MTIWKPNMLAVCIDDTDCAINGPVPFKKDAIYRVKAVWEGIWEDTFYYGTGLGMEDARDGQLWNALNFRPAVQDWQSETQLRVSWLDDVVKGRVAV